VKRVVLIGSESTGKTTLAERLAAHYGASWVPEFVREYAARKNGPLVVEDHVPIARGQRALEDAAVRTAETRHERLLIQDTDLLSTAVYCAHYYGQCPRWIEDAARDREPDLYLLLDIDLPWVPDPQRDRGQMRPEMQKLFRDAVERSGAPFVVIAGSPEERFALARNAIDALLQS
jgi:NadR type nicotinamide-nucleotide adenylyltransferase